MESQEPIFFDQFRPNHRHKKYKSQSEIFVKSVFLSNENRQDLAWFSIYSIFTTIWASNIFFGALNQENFSLSFFPNSSGVQDATICMLHSLYKRATFSDSREIAGNFVKIHNRKTGSKQKSARMTVKYRRNTIWKCSLSIFWMVSCPKSVITLSER